MREPEYRGKRLSDGVWIYGFPASDRDGRRWFVVPAVGIKPDNYEIDPETLGQWTGLKNKRGKRIFEGDIVLQSDWKPKAVVWRNTILKEFSSICGFMLDGTWCFMADYEGRNGKVIGNIYDNPEPAEGQD